MKAEEYMRTFKNILGVVFAIILVVSFVVWLGHDVRNIEGDGKNPSQTLTATILGFRRELSCVQYSFRYWNCLEVQLWGRSNFPMLAPFVRLLHPLYEWMVLLVLIGWTQLYRIPSESWTKSWTALGNDARNMRNVIYRALFR